MAVFTQANRLLSLTTPLGKDALLLVGLQGHEGISELFTFQLEFYAPKETAVPFDKLLGQAATLRLITANGTRYFHGILSRLSQGKRDELFTYFRAELVPPLWLLTRKIQSRIFQHLSIPDIIKHVLPTANVTYEIQGRYHPRDYVVQYNESDFAFFSRLLEEEGMHYYFKQTEAGCQLVVTDVTNKHADLPGLNTLIYEESPGAVRTDARIVEWVKTQEMRSGLYTLWDHCFELVGQNLEAHQAVQDSVPAGKVTHKLKVGGNENLEVYRYPGLYAQRFDGVDKGGTPQPADVQHIFDDNKRTVKIRMEQETAAALEIRGGGTSPNFIPGFQFTLTRHFDADGSYLLTKVNHTARLGGNYRSGDNLTLDYQNRFLCIPTGVPYRPPLVTPRPIIPGTQTATVVGPAGQEIFCDKYGRIKVQFHWDRQGKNDANSSCWIRVAQVWAGKGWGAFFWPRIGHEVVVVFEDGDPDQPLIVGSVYNAVNMPPFALPLKNMLGGLKSSSVRGQAQENYNGIVFDDEKGKEHLSIHSERHLSLNSELDKLFNSGRHKSERVSSVSLFSVGTMPGGGGSGGGADPYSAYQPPQATGVLGLNGIMVLGENLQAALGLNHQIALGSNVQVCINPGGLGAGVTGSPAGPGFTGFLGSGIGGNMQLTVGTSCSFVLGRNYQINLGPAQITVNPGPNHPLSTRCLTMISASYAAWMLMYFLSYDDSTPEQATSTNSFRTELTLGLQIFIDILLACLMQQEMIYYKAENNVDDPLNKAYQASVAAQKEDPSLKFQPVFKNTDGTSFGTLESWGLTGLALLAAVVLPTAMEIVTAEKDKKPQSS
jgi:type VI secretion system secreted protein VgrG